ncbi:MAG: phosphate/phosphite/phosphonate ABC transporter substrate-binding protein [Hyphomicrobiales bacterium]|nr:phosphate/phosphite/phosphonate ABC transporter substrate-binding protein [Hyphomicrobiales bacterium]
MLRTLLPFALGVVLAFGAPAAAQIAPIKGAGEGATTRATKPFRLGVLVGERREAGLRRVEPFRAHLAAALDRDVVAAPFETEAELVGALATGRIDYAPLSAIGYATAARLCDCVEPLAAPRDADRSAGWRAIVLVRADGPIRGVEDLAGRRLAVSRGVAIGTRRLPLMLLARAGLVGDRAPKPMETDGPAAALAALGEGRAEAALVWASGDGESAGAASRGTLAEAVARGAATASDVRTVWASPILPLGPHTVGVGLDERTKRRLREMLIELDADPDVYEAIERVHSGGFIRVGAPSYRPFVDLLTPKDGDGVEPTGPDTPPRG